MQETLQQAGVTSGQEQSGSNNGSDDVNVGQTERWASALVGGGLALYGLMRRTWGGVVLALVGGTLIYRGSTGHCYMYDALGVNTTGTGSANPLVSVPANRGIKVERPVVNGSVPLLSSLSFVRRYGTERPVGEATDRRQAWMFTSAFSSGRSSGIR